MSHQLQMGIGNLLCSVLLTQAMVLFAYFLDKKKPRSQVSLDSSESTTAERKRPSKTLRSNDNHNEQSIFEKSPNLKYQNSARTLVQDTGMSCKSEEGTVSQCHNIQPFSQISSHQQIYLNKSQKVDQFQVNAKQLKEQKEEGQQSLKSLDSPVENNTHNKNNTNNLPNQSTTDSVKQEAESTTSTAVSSLQQQEQIVQNDYLNSSPPAPSLSDPFFHPNSNSQQPSIIQLQFCQLELLELEQNTNSPSKTNKLKNNVSNINNTNDFVKSSLIEQNPMILHAYSVFSQSILNTPSWMRVYILCIHLSIFQMISSFTLQFFNDSSVQIFLLTQTLTWGTVYLYGMCLRVLFDFLSPHNRNDLYLWKYLILVIIHGLNLTLTALNNSQTEAVFSELFIWQFDYLIVDLFILDAILLYAASKKSFFKYIYFFAIKAAPNH